MQPHDSALSPAQASDLGRRELLTYAAAFGTAFLARQGLVAGEDAKPSARPAPERGEARQYEMKKSINLWAFPYPDKWSLKECLELAKDAGFDGVELNFALEGEFSAQSPDSEIVEIRRLAERVGIAVSGVCSSCSGLIRSPTIIPNAAKSRWNWR